MSSISPTLGRLLASGKEAQAFEFGGRVVKLFRPSAAKDAAFREAANMALAERAGLPTPQVFGVECFDGRWGIIMSRAAGPSFAEAIRTASEMAPSYLKAMALLHLRAHTCLGVHFAGLKVRLEAHIRRATILGEATQARLLGDLAARPDGDRLCHGDFHLSNILGPIDRPILLDWLDACSGDPAADVCRSYVLIKKSTPEIASAYVAQYARISGESVSEILSWLPLVAAARLAEGARDETAGLLEMAVSTVSDSGAEGSRQQICFVCAGSTCSRVSPRRRQPGIQTSHAAPVPAPGGACYALRLKCPPQSWPGLSRPSTSTSR